MVIYVVVLAAIFTSWGYAMKPIRLSTLMLLIAIAALCLDLRAQRRRVAELERDLEFRRQADVRMLRTTEKMQRVFDQAFPRREVAETKRP
jgi:hypothetical protein